MSAAELLVLGCSAGSPSRYGPASGYLVRTGSASVLLDCGPGVVGALAASGRPDPDAVLLSHGHADHCADVVALAFRRSFPRPRPPLPAVGPIGIGAVLDALDAVFGIPTLPELRRPLATRLPLTEVEPGDAVTVAGTPVRTIRARHPVPTLSVRFDALGLVYTADTALTPELVALAEGADVLLAEATYLDAEGHDLDGHGHLTAAQAGRLAAEAGVAHLVVTHLSDPDDGPQAADRARAEFAGPVTVARPGLAVPLSSSRAPGGR